MKRPDIEYWIKFAHGMGLEPNEGYTYCLYLEKEIRALQEGMQQIKAKTRNQSTSVFHILGEIYRIADASRWRYVIANEESPPLPVTRKRRAISK